MVKKSMKQKNRHIIIKIFLIIYTVITAVPIVISFLNAFKTREAIQNTPLSFKFSEMTLDSIKNAYDLMKFPEAVLNNVIVLTISLVIMIAFGSLMGYAVAIIDSKFLNLCYIITILVITIPFQAIMIPEVVLLKNLSLLGSHFGTSMVFVATSLPVVVFLYTGFMKALPKELCEAAIVDGAGVVKTYLSIYMPLLKTVTGTVIIVRGTGIWNDLLVCLITLTNKTKLTTLVYRLYSFVSNKFNRWDLVFGASLLISIPIIVLFIFMQKAFVKGVISGAVKG